VVPESRMAGATKSVRVRKVVPLLGSVREREVHATVMEVMLPDWESGWICRATRSPVYLAVS